MRLKMFYGLYSEVEEKFNAWMYNHSSIRIVETKIKDNVIYVFYKEN